MPLKLEVVLLKMHGLGNGFALHQTSLCSDSYLRTSHSFAKHEAYELVVLESETEKRRAKLPKHF
jgi:hypothetical protein